MAAADAVAAALLAGLKPEVRAALAKSYRRARAARTRARETGEDAAKMQRLIDAIESLDDVQDVYTTAVINE